MQMYAADSWIEAVTGAHRITVARWRRARSWSPVLVRLAKLVLDGELGEISDQWTGWRLRHGKLETPGGDQFSAGEIHTYALRLQHLRALERELRQPKSARRQSELI